MKFTLPNQLGLALTLVFAFACQEDSSTEIVVNEEIDKDMVAATELVNDYLGTSRGMTSAYTITVLRFENGQLLYNTLGDTIPDYQPITEETVTGTIDPGRNVFWYSGSGLSELRGIDFDTASEEVLEGDSEEIHEDVMWTIVLPEDPDSTLQFLKYDIIYQFEGNPGPPIRLDPKLESVL